MKENVYKHLQAQKWHK